MNGEVAAVCQKKSLRAFPWLILRPFPLLALVFPFFAMQNKGKHRHPNLTQKTRPHVTKTRRMRAGLFFYSPMLHQYSFDPAGM